MPVRFRKLATGPSTNGVAARQLEAALRRHTLRFQIERLPFLLGLPRADEKRVRSPHPFRRRKFADHLSVVNSDCHRYAFSCAVVYTTVPSIENCCGEIPPMRSARVSKILPQTA